MPRFERLSRVAMIPTAPVLYLQGRRLRRDTPILPPAALPWTGAAAGPDSARLLLLGDSTVAGVGTDSQEDALPGHLARGLAARWQRGVKWTAIGESGATSRDLVERFLGEALVGDYDVVFLSIGASDALGLRSRGAFVADVRRLLTALRSRNPNAVILMSSLPVFERFELLPQPLKRTLFRHSSSLEAGARALVATMDNATMSAKPPPYTEGFFATDRFHPSAIGYRDWAEFAIADAVAEGLLA